MRHKFFKIVILISILSSSLSFALSSSDVNEKMRIANEFYQKGKYKDAISIYEEILDANYIAPELYYNLGNAYYRIGKIGKAILNYERALKLSPGDDDIVYNLRKVNAHTVDKIEELPKLFIVEWWEILVTMFSFYQWLAIDFIFYLSFFAFLIVFIISKKITLKRVAVKLGIVSIAVLLFTIIVTISNFNLTSSSDYAIFTSDNAIVKS